MKLMDSFIPDNLFDSSQETNIPFDLTIEKKELTDLDIRHDIIYLSLSVDIKAKKGKIYSNGTLSMNLQIKLIFEDSKIIKTKSRLNDFNWITKPSVNFSFIKIPITPVVEEYIKKNSAHWFSNIDNYTQEIIQKHYDKLLEYIKNQVFIRKDLLKVDLNINEVKFAYFSYKNEAFHSKLYTEFENKLTKDTKTKNIEDNIPKLSWTEKYTKNETNHLKIDIENDMINFLIEMFYQSLSENKTISIKNKEIKITDLKGGCSENRLIFEAQYSGDFEGSAELSFIPKWHFSDKKIKLEDTNFKINTDDFIPKLTMFFFKGKVREKIFTQIENLINSWIELKIIDIEKKIVQIDGRNKFKLQNYDFPISINDNKLTLELLLSFDYRIFTDDNVLISS